jgi:hypothetical protein
MVLAGTGVLLATDRRIERHLPRGNVGTYGNFSNVALGGTGAALALAWGYGIKTHNEQLREMGSLEVEALVNTCLIYTPMQYVAGRQRPGGGQRLWGFLASPQYKHLVFQPVIRCSLSAMATVIEHEYPKPWVAALAYGATAAVVGGRFLGARLLHWLAYVPFTMQSEIQRSLPSALAGCTSTLTRMIF